MRKLAQFVLCVLCVVAMTASVSGQECGDVNYDSSINVLDLVAILSYIDGNEHAYPVADSADADIDDYFGVTIADAVAHMEYLFKAGELLNCNPTQSYNLGLSASDTVFIPSIPFVPEDKTQLELQLMVSLADSTDAFYFPLLPNGSGGSSFIFDSVQSHTGTSFSGQSNPLGDTVILAGLDMSWDLVRHGAVYSIFYTRTGAGTVGPSIELVNRNELLKYAVEREGDLYQPVVAGILYTLPPDTIRVDPTSFQFTEVSGNPAKDSFYVHLTSNNQRSLQFSLEPTEPWIEVIYLTTIEPTTPESVLVTIDTDATAVGMNYGQIRVVPWDSGVTPSVEYIDVTAEVLAPLQYRAGDFDCDGKIDIVDLTYLILYLFLGGPAPQHCQ